MLPRVNPPLNFQVLPVTPAQWTDLEALFDPRVSISTHQRSRILKSVNDLPVRSIVCFFINKRFHLQGLTAQLIQAAFLYAGEHGAQIVEAYPVEPRTGKLPDEFSFTGLHGPFRESGFVEVARRSETRPVVQYYIGEKK